MDIYSKVSVDKNSDIPAYKQLGDGLLSLIEQGVIKPGDKLPPIRQLATALNLNAVTAVNAYKYLENRRVVYSRMGSGTYVSDAPKPIALSPADAPETKPQREKFSLEASVNFANSSVSPELFPVDEFSRLFSTVLSRDKGLAFSYTDPLGYEPLRLSIADLAAQSGIKASPDSIQIISGAQQGVDVIAKAMLKPGDLVVAESPTYYGAIGAFSSRGALLADVKMEKDGMDMNRLENAVKVYRPRFIYVMPYYQTPTCHSYSLDKKRELLAIAAKYDTYIVEEDNQSEFTYKSDAPVPLKALDYKNRVIYIKTFSKILMPGLRLGYMILPRRVFNEALSAKYTTDITTSGFFQRAFDLYIRDGGMSTHVKRITATYKDRYLHMKKGLMALNRHLSFTPPDGGLSFWLKIKDRSLTSKDLCDSLLSRGVVATPGDMYSVKGEELPFIRLSFAALKNDEIDRGLSIVKEYFQHLPAD